MEKMKTSKIVDILWRFFENCDFEGATEFCLQHQEDDDCFIECLAFLSLIDSISMRDNEPTLIVNTAERGASVIKMLDKAVGAGKKLNIMGKEVIETALSDYCSATGAIHHSTITIYEDVEQDKAWTFNFYIQYNSRPDCEKAEKWLAFAEKSIRATQCNSLYRIIASAYEEGITENEDSEPSVVSDQLVEKLSNAAAEGDTQAMLRLVHVICEEKERPSQKIRHKLWDILIIPAVFAVLALIDLLRAKFGDADMVYNVDSVVFAKILLISLMILVTAGVLIYRYNKKIKDYDTTRIYALLEKAASAGNARAKYELGKFLQETDQNLERAFQLYQEAADAGIIDAFLKLEECYYEGIGGLKADEIKAKQCYQQYLKALTEQRSFPLDLNRADSYLKRAADSSIPKYLVEYAEFLEKHKNAEDAEKYYRESIERSVDEEYILAYGDFLKRQGRDEEALRLYAEHVENESCLYTKCMLALAKMLDYQYVGSLLHPIRRRKNKHAADELVRRAANSGNADAIYSLQFHGHLSKRQKADLIEKAAAAGNVSAMCQLVQKYERKNPEMAFVWAKKAAEIGVGEGLSALGYCYENGIGRSVNKKDAIRCYFKAQNVGSGYADMRLEKLALKGRFDKLSTGLVAYEDEMQIKAIL